MFDYTLIPGIRIGALRPRTNHTSQATRTGNVSGLLSFLLFALVAIGVFLPSTAHAQCPSVGDTIDIRFSGVTIDCSDDTLFVNIELSNPTGANYKVAALSGRFSFNTAMLGTPKIHQSFPTGNHSLKVQSGFWSYGFISGAAGHSIPTGAAWIKLVTLKFPIISYTPGSNDSCIDLQWQKSGDFPPTTVNQYITFTCQPDMRPGFYGSNVSCIADSCCVLGLGGTITNVTCNGANNGAITTSLSSGASPFTYAWADGPTTANRSGLAPGSYTVTVTDADNCKDSATFTVTEPALLSLSASLTHVNCAGAATGVVDLHVAGGTAPFTYAWNSLHTTQDLNGVTAATYSVTVTDAKGCTANGSYTLNEQPPISTSGVITHVTCPGGSNGAVNVTIAGGTPFGSGNPYSYLWSTSHVTEDISGVGAGKHYITITDALSCQKIDSFVVSEPAAISMTPTIAHVSCNGGSDGTIAVAVSGGTPGYSYSWSGSASTSNVASGLSAGTYGLTVTDANGCTKSASYTVTEPGAITITPTVTNASCNGGSNGAISLAVSGGTPAYSYAWSDGPSTSSTRSGLTAGTYTVTVTDGKGCTKVQGITVGEATTISVSGSVVNVSCPSGNNGSITQTVTGGTPGYTYAWSDGPTTTKDRTLLSAGSYTVTITDANGCGHIETYTVSEPAAISISPTITNVSCNGGSDGAISTTVTGGTPGYTYSWSDGPSTAASRTGLVAGTYTVQVTDANGCTKSLSITVSEPTTLSVSGSTSNVTCNGGSDGTILASPSGGTPAYSYAWSDGPSVSAFRSGLAAGSYTVTVTDNKGCVASTTYTLTEPAAIVVTATTTDASCNGGTDGTITVTVTNGVASFSYAWSDGSVTTKDRTGLAAGTYTITVTDANGCTGIASFNVNEASGVTITPTVTAVSCNGGSNGTISLSVSGGTPGYTYAWSDGPSTASSRTGLSAGTYTVTVTDANLCSSLKTITVSEPAAIVATAVIGHVSCNGNADGTLVVSVTGGNGGYTYAWSDGPSTSPNRTGLVAGTYKVTVTDSKSCLGVGTFVVNQPPLLTSTASKQNPSCNAGSDGTIIITPAGGTPGYTYAWSDGPSTSASRTGLAAGTYFVTVTDANGCTSVTSHTLSNPAVLTASSSVNNETCDGQANGSISLTVGGGTPGYTYAWSDGPSTSQNRTGLAAGSYTVTITDNAGCSLTHTASVGLTNPAMTISASTTPTTCGGGNDGAISVSVSGGTAGFTYAWSDGPSTSANRTGLAAGSYTVTVTDAASCSKAATFTVSAGSTLVVTATVTPVSCHGYANGEIALSVSGGTPSYSYAWADGPTTQDRTGLDTGTYSVTVTDASSCVAIHSYTITQPAKKKIKIRFGNEAVACASDSFFVDIQVSNPTGSDYIISQLSGRFTFNTAMLGSPKITNQVMAGSESLMLQSGIWSYGLIDFSGSNTVPASGAWTTIARLGFPIINFNAGGNDSCVHLRWNKPTQSQPTTAQEFQTLPCQPSFDFQALTSSLICPADSCCQLQLFGTTSGPSCNSGNDGSITTTVINPVGSVTYAWSDGPTVQNRSGLSAGSYTLTVVDSSGCRDSMEFVLADPAPFNVSATKQNAQCHDSADGTITLTVSGATAPYTYAWSDGPSTDQNRSGLAADTYEVTITDANGCTQVTTIIITEPATIGITSSITPETCSGDANGAISLSVSGGSPAYTYAWADGPTTKDRSGLTAGSYVLSITDGHSCVQEFTIVVPLTNPAIAVSPTLQHVTCKGDADGAITLAVSGGTPAYSYAWSDGPTTKDRSGLSGGTYTVVITDNAGCSVTKSYTIMEAGAALAATGAVSNASCNGTSDGSIVITVTGGIPGYTYAWSDGPTSKDRSSLGAGAYTITITDNSGCTTTESFNITEPALNNINIRFGQLTVACAGDSVYVYVQVSNPGSTAYNLNKITGRFTFNSSMIDNPAIVQSVMTGSHSLSNSGSIYTYNFSDNSGSNVIPSSGAWVNVGRLGFDITSYNAGGNPDCIDLQWQPAGSGSTETSAKEYQTIDCKPPFVITGLSGLTTCLADSCCNLLISGSIGDVDCFGGNDGTISVTVSGGNPAYTYSWSDGPSTASSRTGLSAGSYTVTVTDALGCIKSQSFTVGQPSAALSLSTSVTDVSCFGDANGAISLTVSGGTSPYAYAWSNSATTKNVSGLSAASYSVTVTDANGCTSVTSATVSGPSSGLSLSTSVTDVNCHGASTGSITLTVSGGTPGYTYSWNTGATTANLTGVPAGTYSVAVTDANGCSSSLTNITVGQPTSLSLSATTTTASCNGGTDGGVNLTVSGGTSPYTYSWSNSATTEDLTNVAAGTYTVTVTDANGCTATLSKNVSEFSSMTVSATIKAVHCFGDATGLIDLTVSGGSSPYTYSWSNSATTQDLVGVQAGPYTVTVVDANNCTIIESYVVPGPSAALTLSGTLTHVSCKGASTGAVNLSVTGGTTPYSYNWSVGPTTEDVSGLPAGTHSVTVTDGFGCTSSAFFTINEPSTAMSVSSSITHVKCNGAFTGSISVGVTGGNTPYSYNWSVAGSGSSISGLAAGSYAVTVTDGNGCTQVLSGLTVTEPSAMTTSLSVSNATCNGGADGSIILTVSGGTPGYTYFWSNFSTSKDLTNIGAGTYDVTITDANGCVTTATANVSESSTLSSSGTVTHIPCHGGSSGSINLSILGGTSPFSYAWSNLSTSQDISGLTAGSYQVTITDGDNCQDVQTFIVNAPSNPITLNEVITDVDCNGDATGAITLNPTGGTPGYTYKWSDGSITSKDRTSLAAGNYTVTVTDANGCILVQPLTINEPSTTLTLSESVTHVTCNGAANGAINLFVSGGTPPYSYSWSTAQTTQDINGLAPGTYVVNVTDANGCTASRNVTITEPSALVVSGSTVDESCSGSFDGSISQTVSGGTGGYTYVWSDGPSITKNRSGLAAGTYSVTVTDGNGCQVVKSYTLTTSLCNNGIVARNDIHVGLPGAPINGSVITNDYDPDGHDMAVNTTPLVLPSFGTVSLSANGDYTYTPSGGFVGEDTFVYIICDNGSPVACDTATVFIEIVEDPAGPGNDPPVAHHDDFVAQLNTAIAGDAAHNDFDPNLKDVLTFTQLSSPANGVVTSFGADGLFGYTPNSGFVGDDHFTYRVCDDGSPILCDTGTITIHVRTDYNGPGNDRPVAVDDGYYTTKGTPVKDTVIINDYDPNGDPILVSSLLSGPSNGTLSIGLDGAFTYTPSAGFTGTDIFLYVLCDTATPAACDTATVYILVTDPANNPPLARNDVNTTLKNVAVSGNVLTNDVEPDGDNITVTLLIGPGSGTLTGALHPVTGAYTYTPSAGFVGQDVFVYQICDDGIPVLCDTAVVVITVQDVGSGAVPNQPPVATPDDFVTLLNTSFTGNVLPNDNDPDGDGISVTAVLSGPSNGTLTGPATNGVFTYTPSTGFIGIDTFYYIIRDSGTPGPLFDTTLVTIHVRPNNGKNQPPVAVDDAKMGKSGQPIVGNVTDNDYDLENDPFTVVSVISGPSNGTLTGPSPSGAYTYQPNPGYVGPDQFVYVICDNLVPKGCDTATVYLLVLPQEPCVSGTATSTTCPGATDGAIDIDVTCGHAPFSYVWSDGPTTTQDRSGLAGGFYTVTVTGVHGTQTSLTVFVPEPAAITITEVITNSSCAGANDGSIALTVAGGTPGFTYAWSGPSSFTATTKDISGLEPGSYDVTVTDSKGCPATKTLVVNQATALTLTPAISNATCEGSTNGSIAVTPSGGSGGYTYQWSTSATTSSIAGLGAGAYFVTVSDGLGCAAKATYTIIENVVLSLSTSATAAQCGVNDGEASVTVSGGSGNYGYAWAHGPTTSSVSGLQPGTYCVTVTDLTAGCSKSTCVAVGTVGGHTITASLAHESCVGGDGAITTTVAAGSGSYTYAWSDGPTTPHRTSLTAGTYCLTVTDASAGCINVACFDISLDNKLAISGSVSKSTCGASTGSISTTTSGGTGSYSYQWSDLGPNQANRTGLSSGTYAVTVTDLVTGCQAYGTFHVDDIGGPTVTGVISDVSCEGALDGQIIVNASGGFNAYKWSDGPSTSASRFSLAPGVYGVTVTNLSSGCKTSEFFTVGSPAKLHAAITPTHASCAGNTDGAISVIPSGGTAPYTYAWSDGPSTSATRSNIGAGTYVVTVTDNKGCTVAGNVTINESSAVVINVDSLREGCIGQNVGEIHLSISGGTPPMLYAWSDGPTSLNRSGLASGSYTITATDSKGCADTLTIVLNPVTPFKVGASLSDNSCPGIGNGEIMLFPNNGSGPFTYSWSTGDMTSAIDSLDAGSYTVQIIDQTTGCQQSRTYTVANRNVMAANELVVNSSCDEPTGHATLTPTGGTAPYGISWTNPPLSGQFFQDSLAAGVYHYVLSDAAGCVITDSFIVDHSDGPTVQYVLQSTSNCGASDGSIVLTVSNGSGQYTYLWSRGDVSKDLLNASKGIYTVTVTDDSSGCQTIQTIEIEGASMNLAMAPQPSSCGASTGAATVNVGNGSGNYSYRWNTGSTGAVLAGVPSGAYQVEVTDANTGCSESAMVLIDDVGGPTVTIRDVDDVTCFGLENGGVDVEISGATAHVFSWSNGAVTEDLINVGAADYVLEAIDTINQCRTMTDAKVVQPDPMHAHADRLVPPCGNAPDASIELRVRGGVTQYQYIWSDNSALNVPVRNNLSRGALFSIDILDKNGCAIRFDSVQLAGVPAVVGFVTSTDDATCASSLDGQVNLGGVLGHLPLSFQMDNNPAQASPVFDSVQAGQHNFYVIDSKGCADTVPVLLQDKGGLQISSLVHHVPCAGSNNGSIVTNVQGGSGNYQFNWSNGATSASISNLKASQYALHVTDLDNGCRQNAAFTIVDSTINVNVVAVSAACGVNDGEAHVTVSGGTGSYSYAWSSGLPATASQKNLAAAVYYVTVTDNLSGCSVVDSAEIRSVGGPTTTAVITDASPCGTSTGSIVLTVQSGVGPFSYLWSNSATTKNLANVPAGVYTVTVTDQATGCDGIDTFEVREDDLSLSFSIVNSTCEQLDGSATVLVSGGTSPYTISWSTGSSNATINDLGAGIYLVSVSDLNGCSAEGLAIVNDNGGPTVGLTSQDISCAGVGDGSINAVISGGTPPYVFDWSHGASTQNVSGLQAGVYLLQVTDTFSGCKTITADTIAEPAALRLRADKTPVACAGGANGAITLVASGGTSPMTFNWSHGPSTATISGLTPDSYHATVTDANGCQDTIRVDLLNPGGIVLSIDTIIAAGCAGASNGQIELATLGGVPPFEFALDGGSLQASPVFSGLLASTYEARVRDANGCEDTLSVTVGVAGGISIVAAVTEPACNGASDGSIDLSIQGGSGNYAYQWAMGDTTASLNSLAGGSYSVTVVDKQTLCEAIAVFTLQSDIMDVSFITVNTYCGDTTGSAEVVVNGGIIPHSYTWSTGDTTSSIHDLVAGAYGVTVRDIAGCEVIDSALISNTDGPVFTALVQAADCGGANGEIALTVTSTPVYSVRWSTGDTTDIISGLKPGQYTVVVTDALGCERWARYIVDQLPGLDLVSATSIMPATCGVDDGDIDLVVSGGSGSYTYLWSNGAQTASIAGLAAGFYEVTVTDSATGCVEVAGFAVSEIGAPAVSALVTDVSCAGLSDGQIELSVSGGSGIYLTAWSHGPANTFLVDQLPAGRYIATITDSVSGCRAVQTYRVSQPASMHLAFDVTRDICGTLEPAQGAIDLTPTGGVPSYAFDWSNGASTEDLFDIEEGTYDVEVTDQHNCVLIGKVTVPCIPGTPVDIVIPDIITPNGDGYNDFWVITGIEYYPENEVKIFNRWGDVVYSSSPYHNEWDGSYKNTGRLVPDGTYYYIVELNDDEGRRFASFVEVKRQ